MFEQYTPRTEESKEPTLQVKHLSNHKLNDLSFDVREGEIVGFYGLVGAGKTELARAIYGVDTYEGDIFFKGRKLQPAPDKAVSYTHLDVYKRQIGVSPFGAIVPNTQSASGKITLKFQRCIKRGL